MNILERIIVMLGKLTEEETKYLCFFLYDNLSLLNQEKFIKEEYRKIQEANVNF